MNISIEFTQEEVVYLKNEIYNHLQKAMTAEDKTMKKIEKDRGNSELWDKHTDESEKMSFLYFLYEKFESYGREGIHES